MSRATKLMKLRRTSRRGWRKGTRKSGDFRQFLKRYFFGAGTLQMVTPTGAVRRVGTVRDVTVDFVTDKPVNYLFTSGERDFLKPEACDRRYHVGRR